MGSIQNNRWMIAAVLTGVTLATMGRLCAGDFTWWDDRLTLFQNPLMNPPTAETLRFYWTHSHMDLYVPVTQTVWAGLAAIAQVGSPDERGITLNPYVFHTANVLLHLVNVWVVYVILRRLVRHDWACAAGALLFGVHPVQVETVGWVSGMKDLLCGTLVLSAVWCYVTSAQRGARRGVYWVGFVLLGLGMLSKPTAVMTPLLLAGLDRWGVGRPWRVVMRWIWPWCVAAAPCLVWTKLCQNVPAMAPVWARPLIALDALAFYLGKLVWPASLTLDYERNPSRVMSRSMWWATAVVPLVVGAVAWVGRVKRPKLTAAGWVFVAGVSPVLGLTAFSFQDFSTVADHYMYIPMLGVALAGAWACARWPGRGTAWVAGVVLALLSVRSAVQAGVWLSSEALFTHAIAVHPESYLGHVHMASEYEVRASIDRAEAPRLMGEAERHQREAVRVRPGRMNPWYGLGVLLIKRGKADEAAAALSEAVERYRPSLDTLHDVARAHEMLGALAWRKGSRAEAVRHFERAVEIKPDSEEFAKTLEAARRERARPATTAATSPSR